MALYATAVGSVGTSLPGLEISGVFGRRATGSRPVYLLVRVHLPPGTETSDGKVRREEIR